MFFKDPHGNLHCLSAEDLANGETATIEPVLKDGVHVLDDHDQPMFASIPGPNRTLALLPAGCVEISDSEAAAIQAAAIGPAPIPNVVSMRQARLALLAAGKLAGVTSAIGALPSAQKEAAQIEWEYATEVRRDSPIVAMLAGGLALDEAALDALFTAAAAL